MTISSISVTYFVKVCLYDIIRRRKVSIFGFVLCFADRVIAGGAAGVFVEAALYPIDTIKTRLQACEVY